MELLLNQVLYVRNPATCASVWNPHYHYMPVVYTLIHVHASVRNPHYHYMPVVYTLLHVLATSLGFQTITVACTFNSSVQYKCMHDREGLRTRLLLYTCIYTCVYLLLYLQLMVYYERESDATPPVRLGPCITTSSTDVHRTEPLVNQLHAYMYIYM